MLTDPGFWVSLIVAVALTAFVIATFGSGLAVLVVAGAIIGAVSAGAGQITSNLAAGKSWNEGLGTAMLVGGAFGMIPGVGSVLGKVGGKVAAKVAPRIASSFAGRAGSRVAQSAFGRGVSAVAQGAKGLASRVGAAGRRALASGPGRVLSAPFRAVANAGTRAGQAVRRGIDNVRGPRVPGRAPAGAAPEPTPAPKPAAAAPEPTPAPKPAAAAPEPVPAPKPAAAAPEPVPAPKPAPKPAAPQQAPALATDAAGNTVERASIANRIAPQRQGRHVQGSREYGTGQGGSYFNSADDAQKVLDAFHDGTAEIIEASTRAGHIKVRVPGVTGTNVNVSAGFPNQPTTTFLIKGTSRVSVVPTAPAP